MLAESELSILKNDHNLNEYHVEKVNEKGDPLQLPMNDSDQGDLRTRESGIGNTTQSLLKDNDILENATKVSVENDSDAANSLYKDDTSLLTSTSLTFGMTSRKKTLESEVENFLKKEKTTENCKIRYNCLQKKCFVQLEDIKSLITTRKSETCKLRPLKTQKNTYDMMRLHCPKCMKNLTLTDTVYVRREPKNCKICNSSIKFICKICNHVFLSRRGIQKHIQFEHGEPKYFQCAHCTYKNVWKDRLKYHLLKKHGFVPNINVHCPLRWNNQKVQFFCPKCKVDLTPGETTNRVDNFSKYCKKCNAEIIFSCKQCHRVYTDRTGIRKHLKFYCGKSPSFICQQCNFQTHWSYQFKIHVKKNHNTK